MRVEQIAYNKGYRITEKGDLYHTNGRKYKKSIVKKQWRFSVKIKDGNNLNIAISRLQAYQKYGDELYDYSAVSFIDGNRLNCSVDNISLGFDWENIPSEIKSKPREVVAEYLGYKVNAKGVLLKNDIQQHVWCNNNGYKVFSIGIYKYKSTFVLLHRLLAYQKYGNKLYNTEVVRHLDGCKHNNTYANISIGSYVDNFNDIPNDIQELRYQNMVRNRRLLTEDVRELIRLDKKNMTYLELSKKYNISLSSVYRITKLETSKTQLPKF